MKSQDDVLSLYRECKENFKNQSRIKSIMGWLCSINGIIWFKALPIWERFNFSLHVTLKCATTRSPFIQSTYCLLLTESVVVGMMKALDVRQVHNRIQSQLCAFAVSSAPRCGLLSRPKEDSRVMD